MINSDGRQYPNHKYLSKGQKQLARLQRQLSRKTKGSRNQEKARIKAARCLERITNQRNDTLHKLSSELVKNYDVICMEDLQAKNMAKSRESATSLADAAWSEFTRQLAYKCEWQHKALVKVSYSQLCSEEGLQRDHDTKAAQHILAEGLRLLGA